MIDKSQLSICQQPLEGFEYTELSDVDFAPRTSLPKTVEKPKAPPLKCQGIKTKLVSFICSSLQWNGQGRWIEPFLGSGAVLFNVAPRRALVADTNPHIIRLYRDIASENITPGIVRRHLECEGELLSRYGAEYYYEVRERFNSLPSSLDFLFLNRACFNGVMRFNRKGAFNVPFCKKPERFSRSYVTKIVNQVSWASHLIKSRDWEFVVADWRETLTKAEVGDLVYADPPYSGRHNDYYNNWQDEDSTDLFKLLENSPASFALSIWKQNKYRSNELITNKPLNTAIRTAAHFYHVGSREDLRSEMEEALIINYDSAATLQ